MPRKRYLSPDLDRGTDCTCHLESVHATDIDPPETVIDPNCPEHGWADPDRAYEDWRDDQSEPLGEIDLD